MNWNKFWDKIWDVLTNGGFTLLKMIGIFILGYIIIRIVKRVVRRLTNKAKMDKLAQKFLINTINFILWFTLVLILIQSAGIPITGLLAAVAAAGLAVALALQDALTSLANGVIIVLTKPFKANDSIVINGISGKVVSVNFFNTVIDTWDNRRIIIPNKNMIGTTIENTNYHTKRRFSFSFKVVHKTDLNELKEILLKTTCSNKDVFTDPMPVITIKEISETGVLVEVRAWANSDVCDGVGNQTMQMCYNEIKRNKIELATNSMVVYNEQREKDLPFNDAPLAERDMEIQPTLHKEQQLSFDEIIDTTISKKLKIKKKNKK